jgi:hypothetical protein
MYFGFRFLYLVAMVCFLLGFLSDFAFQEKKPLEVPVELSSIAT